MRLLALPLLLLAALAPAAACPPERLSHARQAYAPLPFLRDLGAACGPVGVPIVRLEIDGRGRVRGHRFLRSSGCKAADERLRRCLRVWRYEPATCGGKPVADALTLTINWHPEERPGEALCRPEPGATATAGQDLRPDSGTARSDLERTRDGIHGGDLFGLKLPGRKGRSAREPVTRGGEEVRN